MSSITAYQMNHGFYLSPTPVGAYYAVSSLNKDDLARFLFWLLKHTETPEFTLDTLKAWAPEIEIENYHLDLLFKAQRLGLVEGLTTARTVPDTRLETMLPTLLPSLSSTGKVILSDHQGFTLAAVGFNETTADQLSAFSADLASLQQKHRTLFEQMLQSELDAWGLIDTQGHSRTGFWPIYIQKNRFSLIISGFPQLNQTQLTTLIQVLTIRYG